MRTMISFVLMMSLYVLPACEKEAPDTPEQAEVRQVYLDFDHACNTGQGELAASLVASRCFNYYEQLIRYATDGDKGTVLNLRPTDRSEIVMIRNRMDLSELDRMDGRTFLTHIVDAGWYASADESDWFSLGQIQINGDTAAAIMYDEGRKTGRFLDFYREDGAWKIDVHSWDTLWDDYYIEVAREVGMSVDEFILAIEADFYGLNMNVTRWTPMRSW